MKHLHRWLLYLVLGVWLTACSNQDAILIRAARATPAEAQGDSVVLLVLENQGKDTDYLTAVETPIAAQAGLMMSLSVDREEEDIEIEQAVSELELLPHAPLEMSTNGIYIHLSGLKQPLRPGDTFDLVLHFRRAGKVNVSVQVQP